MTLFCCDIHAHCIPRSLVADLRRGPAIDGVRLEERRGQPWIVHRQGPTYPLDPTAHDLEARLQAMDAMGIDAAVVTLQPTLLFYWVETSEAADWARAVNDDIARMAAESGGRVTGVATLPMQDTDAAIVEAKRAVTDLGLKGAQIAPMVLDRTLDDDDYFPVLQTLEHLDVPVILHPYFVGVGHRPGLE
jgi:aminocarboxymuconate-semialdehyde decarboxylase